jgi:hypothetical protein
MFPNGMKKSTKHSPLKEKPLRNPGQYLEEKVFDIVYGEIFGYAVILILLVSMTISEWMRYHFYSPPNPVLLSVITAIAFVVLSPLMYRSIKIVEKYKLGRDGERYVGHLLESVRSKGYLVYHDVDTGKGNIDHILVGPGGIFTIETKTRSKASGDKRVLYNGKSVIEGDGAPDMKPIEQARAEASWLQKFIGEKAGSDVDIQPVVIYPGWYVENEVRGARVRVLNENAFVQFLDYRPEVLNQEQISILSQKLEEYIRSKQG